MKNVFIISSKDKKTIKILIDGLSSCNNQFVYDMVSEYNQNIIMRMRR